MHVLGHEDKSMQPELPLPPIAIQSFQKEPNIGLATKSLLRRQVEKVTKYVPGGDTKRVGFKSGPQRLKAACFFSLIRHE